MNSIYNYVLEIVRNSKRKQFPLSAQTLKFKPLQNQESRKKQCLHNLFSIWMYIMCNICFWTYSLCTYSVSVNVSIWTGYGSSLRCQSLAVCSTLYNLLLMFFSLSISLFCVYIKSCRVMCLIYLFIHCYLFGIVFFSLLLSKHWNYHACFLSSFCLFFSLRFPLVVQLETSHNSRVTEHIHSINFSVFSITQIKKMKKKKKTERLL